MRMRFLVVAALGIGCHSLVADFVFAERTEAEELGKELRQSEDRVLKRMGERWYALVCMQPWTSASGKYTIRAKYLKHDAEEKTVTLIASQRRGDERVEKELTIPIDKLDLKAQSRLRQIERLRPKLEEKQEEVAANAEEEEDNGRGGEFSRQRPGFR